MRFLFGRPVVPARPVADGERDVFVLGAYPSALHVRWEPPEGLAPIAAVAVDNEPEPFWTGQDEEERIAEWLSVVDFRPEWGAVKRCANLNGPSGGWVEHSLLEPLGVDRERAWITDCLDTYFESVSARRRLSDSTLVAACKRLEIPLPDHAAHPSESEIVALAKTHHARLLRELRTARPALVITLGNAALRVFKTIVDVQSAPSRLSVAGYGAPLEIHVDGIRAQWLPLAHPAAPKVYQDAHSSWIARRSTV